MTARTIAHRVLALLIVIGLVTPILRSATVHADGGPLDMYVASVDAATLQQLVASGYDVVDAAPADGVVKVDLVLSPYERAVLSSNGIHTELWRSPDGLTLREVADLQQEEGFDVWRSFDEEGGLRDEIYALADAHPDLLKVVPLGTSINDRDILALKLTKDAPSTEDGTRPASLFMSTQHAREWIGTEVNRRLLHYMLDNYAADAEVRRLVDTAELWFVLVANPDGYQYSFEEDRNWRKNLRDNDGDGLIGRQDGVDPNRNFDAKWGYDNIGSTPSFAASDYRGTGPASEPETQAMQALMDRIKFEFVLNYHSVARLILYPIGWQEQTYAADHPLLVALAGTPENSAIPTFEPVLSADLYPTNGETCTYAYEAGALCYTPELSDQGSGGGFVFPDDEELVQKEFEMVLPFSLDVAFSTLDPQHPVSHLGNTVEPFYVDSFAVSYGDPQVVQVNAPRDLTDVALHYQINDGAIWTAPTAEWAGGKRYDEPGNQYRYRRGTVEGAEPGDEVTVWFEAGGQRSESFTYTLASDTDAQVLVVAAEDYTGIVPTYDKTDGPSYLSYYLDAIEAHEVGAAVYDVDAHERTAPSVLGVLSHFPVVVWYIGDDAITRDSTKAPGTTSRLANEMNLAMRDYVNQGGKLFYTGKYAGYQSLRHSMQYDRINDEPCSIADAPVDCNLLRRDFGRYYLGLGGMERSVDAPLEPPNMVGEGKAWWSSMDGSADYSVTRTITMSNAAAPVELAFDAAWNLETHYDYGYVEISLDGNDWTPMFDADGFLTDEDPNGGNLGWGLTGSGTERLRFDLSTYAGYVVQIRLRFTSDRGRDYSGWFVDNMNLVADGNTLYESDMEAGFDGWENDGWLTVPQPAPPAAPLLDLVGLREPFEGVRWSFGEPAATNQDHVLSYPATSIEMPVDEFPQFESYNAVWLDDPTNRPRTGDFQVSSGSARYSFQRLTRQLDLTDEVSPTLSFWISHDVRDPWDAIFVEAKPADGENWTTLAESNGYTTAETSLQCTTGSWFGRFPRLGNYMSVEGTGDDASCVPTGSTGSWFAATGSSGGWQEWTFELSAYSDQTTDLSISFVTSRLTTQGIRIDDVSVTTGGTTSFEEDWGGWTAEGEPEGSNAANNVDFARATLADHPVSPVVVTPDTITFGFGFEGIAGNQARVDAMERILTYFGVLPLPPKPEPEPPTVYLPSLWK